MVIKAEKNGNYTTMSNYHLRDQNLSLKAKGLLSMILSLPESWTYSIKGLIAISKESRLAIENALKELKENKYLWIEKIYPDKTESGKIEYIYHIYEIPYTVNPYTEKPYIEKQDTENQELDNQVLDNPCIENQDLENQVLENQHQLNTEVLNTKKLNTKESNTNKKYSALDSVADDKLRKALEEFISNRKEMRRPVTDKALELTIKKLYKLADNNDDRIAIIEQSIENGWMGVFPLKEDKKKKPDKMDKYRKIMGEL